MRATLAATLTAVLLGLAISVVPTHAQNRPRETIQVGLIDRTFFPQPVFVAIETASARRAVISVAASAARMTTAP